MEWELAGSVNRGTLSHELFDDDSNKVGIVREYREQVEWEVFFLNNKKNIADGNCDDIEIGKKLVELVMAYKSE